MSIADPAYPPLPRMPVLPANHEIEGDPEVARIELDPYAAVLVGEYKTSLVPPFEIEPGTHFYRNEEGTGFRMEVIGISTSGGMTPLKQNVKFTGILHGTTPVLGFHNPVDRILRLYEMP